MRTAIGVIVVFSALAAMVAYRNGALQARPADQRPPAPAAAGVQFRPEELRFERLSNPPRTAVKDGRDRILAMLTDDARTAALTGPQRTFADPAYTRSVITTDTWVRLMPRPWRAGEETAGWFRTWLAAALADGNPDVLAAAVEYVDGAPTKKDGKGIRYAGDASFGPEKSNGTGREEKSDFYHYLGVPWSFPDGAKGQPEQERYGAVDCSGYVRLVYGYRMGYPLRNTNTAGDGLPRRAFAIAKVGPGRLIIPNRGVQVREYDLLQPGDLVFFTTEEIPIDETNHSGIYLGVDSAGHRRFISSRVMADGPTFGDVNGTSMLDDNRFYSSRFRAVRRL